MSFTISKTVSVSQYDPQGNLCGSSDMTINYEYAISSVSLYPDLSMLVTYTATVNGGSVTQNYGMNYTGDGNPIDQAEAALKTYLAN